MGTHLGRRASRLALEDGVGPLPHVCGRSDMMRRSSYLITWVVLDEDEELVGLGSLRVGAVHGDGHDLVQQRHIEGDAEVEQVLRGQLHLGLGPGTLGLVCGLRPTLGSSRPSPSTGMPSQRLRSWCPLCCRIAEPKQSSAVPPTYYGHAAQQHS